jgi:hypothetical protein
VTGGLCKNDAGMWARKGFDGKFYCGQPLSEGGASGVASGKCEAAAGSNCKSCERLDTSEAIAWVSCHEHPVCKFSGLSGTGNCSLCHRKTKKGNKKDVYACRVPECAANYRICGQCTQNALRTEWQFQQELVMSEPVEALSGWRETLTLRTKAGKALQLESTTVQAQDDSKGTGKLGGKKEMRVAKEV